jgi:lysophospholipase L1-like esterase
MSDVKQPSGPFNSLVVFGESTVEGGGWLSGPEERWADILWKLLENAQEEPVFYYNAGIGASVISPISPGYEASVKPSAAERLQEEVISQNPDLIVIAYGLNDMRAGMSVSAFKTEIKEIIDRIQHSIQALIVIVNVYHMSAFEYYPPFDKGSVGKTKEFNQMLEKLAVEKNCVYADVWSAEGQQDSVIHQDTVHANKIGNMLIAHKVFECIVHAAPGITRNVEKRNAHTEWTRNCLSQQTKGIEGSHGSFETVLSDEENRDKSVDIRLWRRNQ